MWYQECQPLDICKFPTTCSQVQLTPNHQSLDTPTDATQLQHSTVKDCTSQLLIFHHVIFISMLPNFMTKSDDFSWGKGGSLGNSWWGCAVRFSKSWPYFKNVSLTPVSRPGLWEIMSLLLRLDRQQKKEFWKSISNSHISLSFLLFWNRNNKYIHTLL